jgi:hypothetical protein
MHFGILDRLLLFGKLAVRGIFSPFFKLFLFLIAVIETARALGIVSKMSLKVKLSLLQALCSDHCGSSRA